MLFAVDTGYGTLWLGNLEAILECNLLNEPMHCIIEPPSSVDLVVIDLGWTPQKLALPAGIRSG